MAPARRMNDSGQPAASSRRRGTSRAGDADTPAATTPEEQNRDRADDQDTTPVDEPLIPSDLTYQQARTALDLLIAELQASDLQVEEMLSVYRRAQAYADHCEAVLQRVDQDVIEWDLLQDPRENA
jgi:exodeoxyribonuclease VII small subunit